MLEGMATFHHIPLAVMLTISAAAHRHASIHVVPQCKERRDDREAEQRQQQDG
jgi:hypothetical protein